MAKKKKKAKRPAQPGVDPNEKRRERLEAKRAAKAEALAARRKKEARERLIRRVVLLGLLGLAVWFLILRNVTPDEINGHPIKEFSTAGANQHVSGSIPYQDSPPVSGQHAPPPAAPCGVHGRPIPNELMVHTLEHGSVGLLYQPSLELEQIRRLESIVGDYDDHVFSMPYEAMESPITLAAWGHTMELDEVEPDSIEQFIEEFRNGGDAPEKGTPCEHQEPVPFQPAEEGAEEDPAAEPTQTEATPSPTE